MRKLSSNILQGVTTLALLFLSAQAAAVPDSSQSILWVSNVSFSHKNYDLKQLNVGNNIDFTASPNFLTLNFSLTAASGSSYLSINYDDSLSDYRETKINADLVNREENYGYSRTDSNITAGYNLNKSLSVFGGYLVGETKIEYTTRENTSASIQNGMDAITERGLFIGVNYGRPMLKKGTVSVNMAYADLSGEYQYSLSNSVGEFAGIIEGKTSGFSFGIKYTRLVSRTLYFYVGLKLNEYEFESDSGIFNTEQSFTIISSGLTKYFL